MANYQPGEFIIHQEYGVGRVSTVIAGPRPEVEIVFNRNEPRVITEHLLNRNASRLSPDGFHAFAYLEPDQAQKLINENPVEVIIKVLADFHSRRAKTEDFKVYLSSYVKDWKMWWEKTQTQLKESSKIDSTRSQLREYGLLQEELSTAQAAYRSFCRYRKYERFSLVYDQARRVLREIEQGGALTDSEVEDLLGYFRQVIASDQYPIGERLDALSRLVDGRWLTPEKIQAEMKELQKASFRIYDLDPFAQSRVIKLLLQLQTNPETLELIATGMGAQATVIKTVVDWAANKTDDRVTAQLLLAAMSENLPPKLKPEEYPDFAVRLSACRELARFLPKQGPNWLEVVAAFRKMIQAIGSVSDLMPIKIVLPNLMKLTWELDRITRGMGQDHDAVVDSLVDPSLRIEYILLLMDAGLKIKLLEEFLDELMQRLLATTEKRGDDFLLPLVSWRWNDDQERAAGLSRMLERNPGPILIEKAGEAICEIGRKSLESELINLLPFFDRFHRLEGAWSWSNSLEALREKAYFELFQRSTKSMHTGVFNDTALMDAVNQYVNARLFTAQSEIRGQQNRISQYQDRQQELESQLKDKESILRELLSGSDEKSKEARFEERSRIMKDLVGTIAEFERYAENQPDRSKELVAILRRLAHISHFTN